MNSSKYKNKMSTYPPYDLLIIPILVLLAFYSVVLSIKEPSTSLKQLTEKLISDVQVDLSDVSVNFSNSPMLGSEHRATLSLRRPEKKGAAMAMYPMDIKNISNDFSLAIIAASFSELLRDSKYVSENFGYQQLKQLFDTLPTRKSPDLAELKQLVDIASSLN
jgi:hypothetical protein